MRLFTISIALLISSIASPQIAGKGGLKQFNPALTPVTLAPMPLNQPIPSCFYSHHLGFFCKQELKLQQKHIPVTFRLGSMDYCNRLEQKPGYR